VQGGVVPVLFSEAFAKYGTKLKSVNWSVSAENDQGQLILSLWKYRFEKPDGKTLPNRDFVDRWSGNGNKEFRQRIDKAFKSKPVVRVVVARTNDIDVVERW
jgi:hypothetical protein